MRTGRLNGADFDFMPRKIAVLLGLVLVTALSRAHAQEKPADDTIKIETRLVSVPVIVSDRNGRYVPNLTQADFAILLDGAPQTIEFFAATEEPLTIALLIDTSQSTRGVIGDIRDSARAFIKLLTPQDKAMIVSFDYDTHVLTELTSDQEQLKRAIKRAENPERGLFGTTLRDAVFQTINRSFAGIKGRKAIIVLTDGKDAGSRVTTRDLLYSLQETDTLIYTVMFTTDERQVMRPFFDRFPRRGRDDGWGNPFPGGGWPRTRRQDERMNRRRERMARENEIAQEFLEKLSDTTAGRFYSSKNGKLKKTFEMIVGELRFQYRLGFYPPEETNERTLHELKVKIARPETVVRARASYRTQKK
jgi:VWFA-related protein